MNINNDIEILNNDGFSEEDWKVARQGYITGTDVVKIMNYLYSNNSTTYGDSIFKLTELKYNPKPINPYLMKKFKLGHLCEENFYNEVKFNEIYSSSLKNRLLKYNDLFLVRLDCEFFRKTDDNIIDIFEVKSTSSEETYNDYINYKHFNFFQLAIQKYCYDKLYPEKIKKYYINITLLNDNNILKNETIYFDENHPYYIALVEHINSGIFNKILEKIWSKEEYFLEQLPMLEESKKSVNYLNQEVNKEYFVETLAKAIDIQKQIKKLEDEFSGLRNIILNSCDLSNPFKEKYNYNNSELNIKYTVMKKLSINELYKDEYELLEEELKQNFKNKFGESAFITKVINKLSIF